jgi:hypothetical protein
MKLFLSAALVLLIASWAFAEDADVCATRVTGPSTAALGTEVWTCPVETVVTDNNIVGVCWGGDNYVVSGGASATDPNKVYIISPAGAEVRRFDQWNSTGWGWRDLAWDGTYIYGSDNTGATGAVSRFDELGTQYADVTVTGYTSSATMRGMAVNADDDLLYISDWAVNVFEAPSGGGAVTNQYAATTLTAKYGLAWDGIYLWIFDQGGSGVDVYRYDLATQTATLMFAGTGTGQLAGGLDYVPVGEWTTDPTIPVLIGIHQATPDAIHVYDASVLSLTLTPDATTVPRGGTLGYTAVVTNLTNQTTKFQGWAMADPPGPTPPQSVMPPRMVTIAAGRTITQHLTARVPMSAPLGVYTFDGYVGGHPDLPWAHDGFEFSVTP